MMDTTVKWTFVPIVYNIIYIQKLNRQRTVKITWKFIIQDINANHSSFNSKLMASGLDSIDSTIMRDDGRKSQNLAEQGYQPSGLGAQA